MAVAWTVFTRVAVADKASVRTASQSPFVPQRLPATWPLQIASAKGSRSQKLPQKSVSEHRLRGKRARANNLGQWGNGHMHAVTRAHAKIQSVANKMRVHAWSQKSVKGGVRRRRSLSCLFFDTLRNLSYGWCLVEKRRLLTRRRRHVVQGRVPLPTTTLCSLQKGRPEPSFPRAGTSGATRTAYARRTGQTLVASGGEPNARPPRVGPQQPKQKGGPRPRPGRSCPRQP